MEREPRWLTIRGKFWNTNSPERWLVFDVNTVQFITTGRVKAYSALEFVPAVLIRFQNRDIEWLCADEDEQKRRFDWLVYEITRPEMGDSHQIEEITNNLEDI